MAASSHISLAPLRATQPRSLLRPVKLRPITAPVGEEPSRELIERAKERREPEQTQLLEYLHPCVYRQICFLCGFGPEADDCAQESMLEIYRSLPRFAHRASVRTWAHAVATRTTRHYLRRHRRQARPPDETTAPSGFERSETPDLAAALQLSRALEQLSAKKREAFVLMDVMGMTARESGQALGTFANTAASRCRHARVELQALLDGEA